MLQAIQTWRFEQKLDRIEEWAAKPAEQDEDKQDK